MGLSRPRRQSARKAVAGAPAADRDTGLLKPFGSLQEFMLETAWEDGADRLTATVLLFAEEGLWKLMVNDRDSEAVAFVSGPDARSVFASADKGLAEDTLDWRVSRRKMGRK